MIKPKHYAIKLINALRLPQIRLRLWPHRVVLMYHSVECEYSGYPSAVGIDSFDRHLDFLLRHFSIVSLESLLSDPSMQNLVALTFDDAYEDFYHHVFPRLVKWHIPATVFVPTGYIESDRRLLQESYHGITKPHLTWNQMKYMYSTGLVAFESHSHSHSAANECIDAFRDDLRLSIHLLEKHIGRRPCYLAYPFGVCNEVTHRIAIDCGFERVFTTRSESVQGEIAEGRFDIARRNEHDAMFRSTVAGLTTDTLRYTMGRIWYRCHLSPRRRSVVEVKT